MAELPSSFPPGAITMTGQHNVPISCQSCSGAVVMNQGMWKGHDACPVGGDQVKDWL